MDLSPDIVLIAGTGIESWSLERVRATTVQTPYGSVPMDLAEIGGRSIAMLRRHGPGHVLAPHRVNYRALIWAVRRSGCRDVLATAAVGAIRPDLEPGRMLLLDDFIDLTEGRPSTFYDHAPSVRHVDMTRPYCPRLSSLFRRALLEGGETPPEGIVYAATRGPRFETPAEIRALGTLGADVVGMTQAPEAALAREAGLCYAAVAIVTNPAAHRDRPPISEDDISQLLSRTSDRFRLHFLRFLDLHASAPSACPSCPREDDFPPA